MFATIRSSMPALALAVTLVAIIFTSVQTAHAATINVPAEQPTIQDAIDTASPGDIIQVAAGTYTEDLSIPAALTDLDISGAGVGSSVIVGVTTVPAASFPLAGPNIDILGRGTKLHGFTIQSPAYVSGFYSSGVLIGAMDVELYDNAFETNTVDSLGDISQAIITYAESAIPGVDVSGLSVRDNTFSGLGGNSWGYEAIYVNPSGGAGDVTIADNTFTGNILRAITSERSDTIISGNSILTDVVPTDSILSTPGSYQGINVRNLGNDAQSRVTVMGNTIGGSGAGFGFLQGIRVGQSASQTLTDFSITHNTISGNTTGIYVASAGGVVVNRNSIDANTDGVNNADAAELDASCNWWGDASGPSGSGPGTGDTVSPAADFGSWLTSADLDGLCNGPLPPPTPRNINSTLIRLNVTSRGAIDNETGSQAGSGENTAEGSEGGDGGEGGDIEGGTGDESNGGASAGNGGSGGSASAAGLVETGDASADAASGNDLNTTDGEIALDCACGDINGLTLEVGIDNSRITPTLNSIDNLTQARARTGESTAEGSEGGDGGDGGEVDAGTGDESNGGASAGTGGSGGAGDVSGTIGTGSALSVSSAFNSINFSRIRFD